MSFFGNIVVIYFYVFVTTGPLHSQTSHSVLSESMYATITTAGEITTEQNESYGIAEIAAPHTEIGSSSHGNGYLEIIEC